ncbi:glycosyltransferase [Stieleria sp. JC731]|uniref:glycosyltransferase family 2 protein n=1 Tax=Pirellulaceae TaxID=2691357 RepID=UPI001E40D085|nr:glycosyltransferase family 2 protein [Stieleria sp. JC731]MCC9599040.1 glycosyltransferase [Stieleria sp. JC731]
MVRVSFIIPTLNQAAFLARCIDSCLAQGISDSEILVQDGGSTDGTDSVLLRYGSKVSAISEPDDGQSDAINRCIRRADGDIIAWINSDDYYPTGDVLKVVSDAFEADNDVDIVYGDGMYVDQSGNSLRRFNSFPIESPRKTLIAHPTSPCSQPALFFRRELFEKVGGLRQDLHWAMDHELWFRMFTEARKWRYIPQVFAHMTLHSDAKSVRAISKQINEVAAIKNSFLKANHGRLSEYVRVMRGTWMVRCYQLAYNSGLLKYYWRYLQKRQSTRKR